MNGEKYLHQVDSAESVCGLDVFSQNDGAIADNISSGTVEGSRVDHPLALKLAHDLFRESS